MNPLSLEQSNRLIAAVFAAAAERSAPPLAVAVIDHSGHPKALQRQDGVSFMRAEICQAKAWGALAMGVDSAELADRFTRDELQRGFFQSLNAMSAGRIVALPGGLLIQDAQGAVVGALGVAGGPSELDEACGVAALAALGLRAPTAR